MLGRQSALPYKVIALGQPGAMLQVKECLERGEVVGILADRVYANEATQSLPFLGSPARFSLSPFRLARITGAPVLSVFGLRRRDRHYDIVFEALADRVDDPGSKTAPTASSDEPNTVSLERCLTAYVESLELQARRYPYNWFNFYDYWKS
jgi:predicted LPLAT superfamily acyltransferase